MAIQLVTDQFSDNLDGTFRNGMVGNFKIVEQTLNELLTYQGNINKQLSTLTTNINTSVDGKLTKQDSALADKLKAQSQDLTERISHVIMGTDTDSIHAVLNKMILDGELRGQRGDAGKDGRDGLDGESAYQIWLDAGNVGSKADYLASMASSASILQGKTLDIIGDSYVANNGQPVSQTWHYKVANQHSMKYNNYGINGNGLITTKATGTPVVNRVGDMDSSADYVIVVGGKNDYNQQLAITDFKDGLANLIQELVGRFVGKKICFFTPWSIAEPGTMNIPLSQYSQAIEDVCGAYSIPCFNSAKRSGILAYNGSFRAKYFQTSNDSSHLNDAGHNLFVNPATKFLESL